MNKNMMLSWMKAGHLSVPKLLIKHYHQIGLDEKQFVVLLHVYMSTEEGCLFPTPEDLGENLSFTPNQCGELLSQLLTRGYLQIEQFQDESNIRFETYSFDCLWEKLIYFLFEEEEKVMETQKESEEKNSYSLFEQEFGRPLSPIECETLKMWIDEDGHSFVLIKAALREAVVSSKLSFRYIDRILFEWKKNGIKTLEQAKTYGEKFRKTQQQKPRNPSEKRGQAASYPAYNWLEQ
jgi:DNA replication protein